MIKFYTLKGNKYSGGRIVENAIHRTLARIHIPYDEVTVSGYGLAKWWKIYRGQGPCVTDLGMPGQGPCVAYIHYPLFSSRSADYAVNPSVKLHRTLRHPGIFRGVLGIAQKRRIKHPDTYCLTNAQWVADALVDAGAHNVAVAYPPVEINAWSVDRARQEQIPRTGVASVGRLVPSKNHTFVAACCPDMTYVYGATMHNLTTDHVPTYPGATVVPNLPYNDMFNELVQRKCVMSGARQEDFGIAVPEAVLCGCIPCVPDSYGFRETIPYEELRYKPGDKASARKVVDAVLAGDYDTLLEPLQEHILRNFNFQRFADACTPALKWLYELDEYS